MTAAAAAAALPHFSTTRLSRGPHNSTQHTHACYRARRGADIWRDEFRKCVDDATAI